MVEPEIKTIIGAVICAAIWIWLIVLIIKEERKNRK